MSDPTQIVNRFVPAAAAALVVGVLAIAGLSRVGCVNMHTPAGHEGYVRSKPIAGAGKFVGIQRGPTSTGWVWRQEVVNIDMRPRTFSEEMIIRTRKGSELKFRAHARVQLRNGSVREVVEHLGGENWYAANVQKQFQAEVRSKVQSLEPFDVKNRSIEIAEEVLALMVERYKDSSVEFMSVDIGDIEYPQTIVESVIRKFVTFQENEKKDIEQKIALQQIGIGTAEARGIADAQQIIRTTLDPMFLQYEALGAIEQLSSAPNTTFLVMPFAKNGSSPVIMNMGN